MATTDRRKDTALIQDLQRQPWRFEFFQAVRLLEWIYPERKPVGLGFPVEEEVVRFRALPSRGFPSAAVVHIDPGSREDNERVVPEMQVSFMGLTGPAGVLPEGYLDLIQQHLRQHDGSLRDFFDLFNHRTISLFYRAWEKYRFPIGFERSRRAGDRIDLFSHCLASLAGVGTGGQSGRLPYSEDMLLRYVGHFAHFPRSAVVLEAMLADYLRVPVAIEQMVGRWLPLEPGERSQLPSAHFPEGRFSRLGVDLVIGDRVWDLQSCFRIRLGPLQRDQFSRLLPVGSQAQHLRSLAAMYVGPELDFEIRLILRADQVPGTRLGGTRAAGSRLGWTTWLCSVAPDGDRDDLGFYVSALS